MTKSDPTEAELIQRAVAGDGECLSILAQSVQARVLPYFCRVLLDEEKAQELTQETVVSILGAVGSLRHVERFWPWAFRIATNQLRQFFRTRSRRKAVSMSAVEGTLAEPACTSQREIVMDVARRELAELTRSAMSELSERHRMVLALRFYEDLPHAEIARVLGCTELVARMIFFRAKGALVQRLRRRGIKDASVLVALAAFGELTAPPTASAAVVSVSAATLGETALAGLFPVKAKITAAICGLLLAGGAWWMFQQPLQGTASSSGPPPVRNIRFTEWALTTSRDGNAHPSEGCRGAYEQWVHLPQGVGGPFLFRMQRWNPQRTQKLCWWVQNEDANYYVFAGDGTVYLNNARLYSSSMMVKLLPTDPAEFRDFVHQVEGVPLARSTAPADELVEQRDPVTGYLRGRIDSRFPELGPVKTNYEYSDGDPAPGLFAAPVGPQIIDERDDMHRRGWTYFRIQGQLNGHDVLGRGCLPFTYRAGNDHPAWLTIQIGGQTVLCDSSRGAAVLGSADGRSVVAVYEPGSLFAGLPRPWTGFHTLDTIRRDAAALRLSFSTQVIKRNERAEIAVVDNRQPPFKMARYHVDIANDLVTDVTYWSDDEGAFTAFTGVLQFEYLQDVAGVEAEFTPPAPVRAGRRQPSASPGPLWPLVLIAPAPSPSPQAAAQAHAS